METSQMAFPARSLACFLRARFSRSCFRRAFASSIVDSMSSTSCACKELRGSVPDTWG